MEFCLAVLFGSRFSAWFRLYQENVLNGKKSIRSTLKTPYMASQSIGTYVLHTAINSRFHSIVKEAPFVNKKYFSDLQKYNFEQKSLSQCIMSCIFSVCHVRVCTLTWYRYIDVFIFCTREMNFTILFLHSACSVIEYSIVQYLNSIVFSI